MIPLFKVYMANDVDDFVLPVLHSGYIGEGDKTKLFEKKFGEYIGNDNVVVVNSGTSAITMALKLSGVGYRSKVISTPMTCLATNMAILFVGADIIWADILSDGTIDPKEVEKKIKWEGDIRAIVCMDWGGQPCKLNELKSISNFYHIPIIEDACQAIGSIYNDRLIGSDADFVCFSFQAIKHLTTGDGGALVINNDKLVNIAKAMRWFGLDRSKGADMRCNQDPPVAGYKWQMNDITASIGLANIRGLEERIKLTRQHAKFYNSKINFNIKRDEHTKSSYWLYTICVLDVDNFISYMKENGVECSRVHDRNDTKTVFQNFETRLPTVDFFDEHHVCIPVGWWLTNEDAEKIAKLVNEYKGVF